MGKSARPLSLDIAVEQFNTTRAQLQELIDSGECSIGDVKGTIMCTYDSNTQQFALQRKSAPVQPVVPAKPAVAEEKPEL